MTDPKCTCELIDVSTHAGPEFIRGRSRGCQIHPEGEWERHERERAEAREARIAEQRAAAERLAREAP